MHSSVPQSLTLWHNGHTVLSSPGNTGVPAAPTQLGTFPVFEHIPIGTMSGTNPDGSHYHDPGIRYISYLRRRRHPRLQPRLVRDAAEPRLCRAATRLRRQGLAIHPDRHARHHRELNELPRTARPSNGTLHVGNRVAGCELDDRMPQGMRRSAGRRGPARVSAS